MTMISCHITWHLPLQLGVTYVGSGCGGGDVSSEVVVIVVRCVSPGMWVSC